MLYTVYVALFLPLIGFLILLAMSSRISRVLTGVIACSTILLSFIFFSSLVYVYESNNMSPQIFTLYKWIPFEGINADFALRVDPLSLVMTLIITGVGFLIHVYSNGYMEHDEDYARYFACMNFFVFMMLLLVLAGNLALLFVGWEGVGLASYLLIGYYYSRPSAAEAATKAFVINRIGDWGLLIGLILTFHTFGTSDISTVTQQAAQGFAIGAPILSIMTLLYFIGATGKSAQIPLHTWLPDAMEGPTPVSALIHAATMVTAGVYLVVRMHPVFMQTPYILHIVGAIGGITSLFAALCAIGQTDIKRVLAYSTVSQLGLMFLACGVGAFYAAMFHLTTHAFIKGLLFLSAGNVVHMMHDETEMSKMGGLHKQFYVTHWMFLVGALALSGIPPMAAFFSKDLILEQEHLAGFDVLYWVAFAASMLTAFYLTRAYCLTFLGKPRLDSISLKSIHEAPKVMLIPVTLLAILAIFGGFLGFAIGKTPLLESFLEEVGVSLPDKELDGYFIFTKETLMSVLGGIFFVVLSAWIYIRYPDRIYHPIKFLRKSLYIDEIYWYGVAVPVRKVAKLITDFFEPKVFEGSIQVTANTTQGVAGLLQRVQSGQIRSYAAWMLIGVVLLLLYFVL